MILAFLLALKPEAVRASLRRRRTRKVSAPVERWTGAPAGGDPGRP